MSDIERGLLVLCAAGWGGAIGAAFCLWLITRRRA